MVLASEFGEIAGFRGAHMVESSLLEGIIGSDVPLI
jgi:hypothetical protein